MDIADLLRKDHREIEDLLVRLQRSPGEAHFDLQGRKYLLDRLIMVASQHEAAEEMAFWPDVRRRVGRGSDLADRALAEERDARAVLNLLRVTTSEADIVEECRRLDDLLRKHIDFEENVVLAELHKHSTRIYRSMASVKFRAARRLAPTRPHPKGPDRPLGFMTLGAPAMLLDHLRDRRGRRHLAEVDDGHAVDGVAVLRRDHARITDLLSRIETEEDPDDQLIHELIRRFSMHDSIERQHLYPLVRTRLPDGNDRYALLLEEHGQIAALAAKLDRYRFHDAGRQAWLAELSLLIRTHIEQEEGGVLSSLAARMTHEELEELGAQLESSELKAPTRPHPHLAGSRSGARLSRRVLRPLDRTRDLLSGHRTR